MVRLYRDFVICTLLAAFLLHYGPHVGGVTGLVMVVFGALEAFAAIVNAILLVICSVTGLRPPDR